MPGTLSELAEARLWASMARQVLHLGAARYAVLDRDEVLHIGSWPEIEPYILTGEQIWDQRMDDHEWGKGSVNAQILLDLGLGAIEKPVVGIRRRV